MQITHNMVLYYLRARWSSTIVLNEQRKAFCTVALPVSDPSALSDETLYVVPNGYRGQENADRSGLWFVTTEMPEKEPEFCSVVVVPDVEWTELFNGILYFFSRLNQWDNELTLAHAKRADLQTYLDISADLIKYGTCVWDPTFSLIAYSKNVESDNFIFKAFVSNGYLPSGTAKEFLRMGKLSKKFGVHQTFVHYPPNVAGEIEIVRSFHIQLETSAVLCMFVGNDNPHPGYVEMIDYLCIAIQKHYNRIGTESQGTYRSVDAILRSLITNSDIDYISVQSRLEMHSLPMKGLFSLYVIILPSAASAQVTLMISQLRRNMPNCEVFLHDGKICVLNQRNPKNHGIKGTKFDNAVIERFLGLHDAFCGISMLFESLTDLSGAYAQASTAAEFGWKAETDTRIFQYFDFFVDHILSLAAEKVNLTAFCFPPLISMLNSDQRSGTNNIELLRTYLDNDRNITKTAEKMHMHRNSIVYRVARIVEKLEPATLDNPNTRLHILLSLKILERMNPDGLQSE